MTTVYLLHHSREDDESEDIKLIGVFSSATAAEDAMKAVKDKPGFREHPQGFSVDEYEIDRCWWTDGFGV